VTEARLREARKVSRSGKPDPTPQQDRAAERLPYTRAVLDRAREELWGFFHARERISVRDANDDDTC
jgi:hypothetical protein